MTATVALRAAGGKRVPAMHVRLPWGLQEPGGTDRPAGASNPYMDDDMTDPELPAWAEAYMAEERSWWRLLRETGAMDAEQARADLRRWTTDER